MRKFLAVAAVAVLVLAVAVPAMALDFKFGGEYRVRFYTYNNAGFTEGTGTNPRGAQVRVRPRFDASDDNNNITATLRLEIGDVEFGNGGGPSAAASGYPFAQNNINPGGSRTGPSTGGAIGNDGVNVETKWAYIDAAFPFGVPLRVRAGLQPWYLPKGIIVDDDVAGVRFYGTTNPVSYDLSWYRLSSSPVVPSPLGTSPAGQNVFDNNLDFYNAKVDFTLAKWLSAGLYGGYGRHAANPVAPNGSSAAAVGGGPVKTWLYYGISATGDLGFLKYDFDFVGGRNNGLMPTAGTCQPGRNANCIDASGFGFDAGVHIPLGPAIINVGGSYFTGDAVDGGISEAMPFISPGWNGPGNMMFEMFGAGGVFDPVDLSQDFPAGTWTFGLSAEYRPVKALWLKLGWLYQNLTQNDANCVNTLFQHGRPCFGAAYARLATDGNQWIGKTMLGNEINLRADWDVWTGFKVMTTFGAWIPSSGDTTLEYALQLLYNF